MTKVARYVDALSLRAKQINEQVRGLIDHPAEKGRAAEHIVRGLVREILPKKFSMGTGFVVTANDKRSPQQDIVLFDEQLNAPLVLAGDIGIFPIECVYATIEVKSSLTKATLIDAAKSIGKLRKFKEEKVYDRSVTLYGQQIDPSGVIYVASSGSDRQLIAPRSYIFAFRTTLTEQSLMSLLEEASEQHGAFFHGVVILQKDWFAFQGATRVGVPKRFGIKKKHAINEFALKLSKDVLRYPMYAAHMEPYLHLPPEEQLDG
jgi:hypothetical protein